MSIILYTDKSDKRLEYISNFLFQVILGIPCQYTTNLSSFRRSNLARVNYSHQVIPEDCLTIPVHPFLSHRPLKTWDLKLIWSHSLPAFFAIDHPAANLKFDLFAMAFFMLSRHEEYLPFSPDAHQRFPAKESFAYQQDILHLPLIDLWALEIRRLLHERFPKLRFAVPNYRFRPSIDIDMAWSFKHKGWLRNLGAMLREGKAGQLTALRQRLGVLAGLQPDPFDTFEYLERLHLQFELQPVYFWLLGQHGPYDKNIDPKNRPFRQLIERESKKKIQTGIHPSYQSNTQPAYISAEKQLLEQITGQQISRSRQHFLMLRLPLTYRQLLKAGITEDFSMGYAAALGFRAGTSHPFFWYDLEKDEVTALKVHPFQIMDVSLQKYLGYSPAEALAAIEPMVRVCRKVGGQLMSIWHNSSFTEEKEWKGWRRVYEKLLMLAAENP